MYDEMLLPTDGSGPAGRAVEHGVAIATAFDATVHALYVVDVSAVAAQSDVTPADALLDRLREQGDEATTAAAQRAREAGCDAGRTVIERFPSGGILVGVGLLAATVALVAASVSVVAAAPVASLAGTVAALCGAAAVLVVPLALLLRARPTARGRRVDTQWPDDL